MVYKSDDASAVCLCTAESAAESVAVSTSDANNVAVDNSSRSVRHWYSGVRRCVGA
jgi:hypothetical protein